MWGTMKQIPILKASSVSVKVKFNIGEEKLTIEKWKEGKVK